MWVVAHTDGERRRMSLPYMQGTDMVIPWPFKPHAAHAFVSANVAEEVLEGTADIDMSVATLNARSMRVPGKALGIAAVSGLATGGGGGTLGQDGVGALTAKHPQPSLVAFQVIRKHIPASAGATTGTIHKDGYRRIRGNTLFLYFM